MRYAIQALAIAAVLATSAAGAAAQGFEDFSRAFAAHGPNAAEGIIQTLRITGTSKTATGSQPFTFSASLDGQVRLDYGRPVTRSRVTTPSGHFEVRGNQVRPMPAHVNLYGQLDLLSVFAIRRFAVGTPEPLGTGAVEGRSSVRYRAHSGREQIQYLRRLSDDLDVDFDRQTGLVAAVTRTLYADNSLDLPFTRSYLFADHRNIGDLIFPFRIQMAINGRVVETFLIDAVERNPVFQSRIFER